MKIKTIAAALCIACCELPTAEAQGIIDVHCHNVQASYMEFLREHDTLLEEGFPIPSWDVKEHLQMMDENGIACAVLSMPAPQPFYGNVAESKRIVRRYNTEAAAIKRQWKGRFKFCASLPLPDVGAAVSEAVYALDTLHADGIKLATNSRGQYLGDPALDTLMAVLNERHAVIILHPHKPVPVNVEFMQAVPLAVYDYPAETTRAVINMIAHNVPSRYPNLRFVIPHCGSFLPLAIARMRNLLPIVQQAGRMKGIDIGSNMKNFYYDLAGGITPDALQSLLTITTPDRLLFGSDYPYVKHAGIKGMIENLHKTLASGNNEVEEDILIGNARRLFTK